MSNVSTTTVPDVIQTTTNTSTILTTTTPIINQTTTTLNATTTTTEAPTTSSYFITTTTAASNLSENKCLTVLYQDIYDTRVRIWDVVLFVPNAIFLIFVLYRMRRVWHRILSGIGSGGSPIFVTYFTLVAVTAILAVIRCVVSMTVDATTTNGNDANKILWVVLRFFLLMAELSVLVFGVAFGHLDSKTSIKRVLFVTTLFALVYSVIQGTLELVEPDPRFDIDDTQWTVYSHGGSLFCCITSIVFLMIYLVVLSLPLLKFLQKYLSVPTRKSFYIYVAFMSVLYFLAALGSGLLLYNNMNGLCLLNAFSLAYFTIFAPMVYWTFLSSYFGTTKPNSMLFSYATHVDEGLPDIADYDVPTNGITVDSTLSGILVFDHGQNQPYQIPNGHAEQPLHDFASQSFEDYPSTTPDSSASFFNEESRND